MNPEIIEQLKEQSNIIRDDRSGEWAKNIAYRECDRLLDELNQIQALELIGEIVI